MTSMDIFTDEMIYSESWGNLAIRILLIVSLTQVVVMSRNINDDFRAREVTALQQ